jgi:hypothetical protein
VIWDVIDSRFSRFEVKRADSLISGGVFVWFGTVRPGLKSRAPDHFRTQNRRFPVSFGVSRTHRRITNFLQSSETGAMYRRLWRAYLRSRGRESLGSQRPSRRTHGTGPRGNSPTGYFDPGFVGGYTVSSNCSRYRWSERIRPMRSSTLASAARSSSSNEYRATR